MSRPPEPPRPVRESACPTGRPRFATKSRARVMAVTFALHRLDPVRPTACDRCGGFRLEARP